MDRFVMVPFSVGGTITVNSVFGPYDTAQEGVAAGLKKFKTQNPTVMPNEYGQFTSRKSGDPLFCVVKLKK